MTVSDAVANLGLLVRVCVILIHYIPTPYQYFILLKLKPVPGLQLVLQLVSQEEL